MIRTALVALLLATPVSAADSKEQSCDYQAQVVAAIQQARLDKVKERNVAEAIAATEPGWPENYNNAIPLLTPWVYEMKMKVIREEDLSAVYREQCIAQQ